MRYLPGIILLLPVALFSQAPITAAPANGNCPVTLVAQPYFDQGVVLAGPHHPLRAGVSLYLEDLTQRPIRGADVTLRGTPARHGAQLASLADPAAAPTRTFHIQTAGATPGTLAAKLWLAQATTITTVTLTAIDYTNAPAWHAGLAATCTTTPSGNLLIGRLR